MGVEQKGPLIALPRSLEMSLVEIIKYGSKIFTEPDLKKKARSGTSAQIYIKALDTILAAMKGKRIFDRFGFNLPMGKPSYEPRSMLLSNFTEWEYDPSKRDWISSKTGEKLTDFDMGQELEGILKSNLDTENF